MKERELLEFLLETLEPRYVGNSTRISQARNRIRERLKETACHRCAGLGWITVHDTHPMGGGAHNEPCPTCGNKTIAPPSNVTVTR